MMWPAESVVGPGDDATLGRLCAPLHIAVLFENRIFARMCALTVDNSEKYIFLASFCDFLKFALA